MIRHEAGPEPIHEFPSGGEFVGEGCPVLEINNAEVSSAESKRPSGRTKTEPISSAEYVARLIEVAPELSAEQVLALGVLLSSGVA